MTGTGGSSAGGQKYSHRDVTDPVHHDAMTRRLGESEPQADTTHSKHLTHRAPM